MKKRNLFLVLMLTLVMLLTACGGDEVTRRKRSKDKDNDNEKIEDVQDGNGIFGFGSKKEEVTINFEEKAEQPKSDSDEKEFKIRKDLSVENAGVIIEEYYVKKDYNNEEEDIVSLKITYTNNADRDRSFWHNTSLYAYQGGVRLDYGTDAPDTDDDMYVQIQPGTSVTFIQSFALRDLTTDVELKFSSPYNSGYGRYESECTISIK